jgi:signal peptidase
MKKIKTVFSIIWYSIVGLLTILVCYAMISKFVFKNPAPSMLGFYAFNVETGSMVPTLSVGDLIIVRKTDVNELNVDDVISYIDRALDESGNSVTTHRISKLLYDESGKLYAVKTTGDFIGEEENYEFLISDILGKYTGVKFNGFGILKDIITSPTGICFFLFLVGIAILIPYWRTFFPKKEKKEDDSQVKLLEEELEKLKKQVENKE